MFRCNILIGGKIIKEMPGSVASGTPCSTSLNFSHNEKNFRQIRGEIKTQISWTSRIFRKSCLLLDNVEKYDTGKQATNGNITWRKEDAICATYDWRQTQTHNHNIWLLLFLPGNIVCANALQCYIYAHCVSCCECNWTTVLLVFCLSCRATGHLLLRGVL